MTVFFIRPSVLPELLEILPGAEIHEGPLRKGEIGLIDGRTHIVTTQRIVPFESPRVSAPISAPRPRGAQWKSERGLAGRRWGK